MICVKYFRRNVFRVMLFGIVVALLMYYNYYYALKQPTESATKHCSSRTSLCQIKKLDPWDSSITKFFKKLPPFNCPKTAEDMLVYQTEDGFLKIDEQFKNALMKQHEGKEFKCTKQEVYRKAWEENEKKNFRLNKKVTKFDQSSPMDVEFAEIKCYAENASIYHNYFFNVIRKPKIETECAANSKQFLINSTKCIEGDRLSVLVMGIDSVSKSNLYRQLPQTVNYVRNNLSGVEMSGYNKVGLNTFPSLIPYFTGNNTEELESSCYGKQRRSKFDNCTFLWDLFAKAGYRTAFVDNFDEANIFLYNRGGFNRQIAHYYSHTLYLPVNKKSILKNGCWRGKSDDARVVDWALMFQKQFAHDLHYGHFWTNIFSHNYVSRAQFLDPIYLSAFQKMKEENLLNNTVLIFMSDHGIRYGKIRETEVGRKEENLPFMYLVFPQWFRDKHPVAIENLLENSHRLITTFDLHETIKSIINCDYPLVSYCLQENPPKRRGVSLFTSISENRTCEEAGIPGIYCACETNVTNIAPESKEAKDLAQILIDQINGYTESLRNVCAKFQLENVLSAKLVRELQAADVNDTNAAEINSHVISVLVKPGGAKFEGTIHSIPHNMSHAVEHDVQRINKYGNSSYCISENAFLKTICFCV